MVLAEEWGVGQVLWTFIWFTLFFIWIYLLIVVFMDIFRSHDLSGWAKALWVIGIIIVPYLGVFLYLIVRGHKMSEHAMTDAKAADDAQRAYIQQVAGSGGGPAAEIQRLADLKSQGAIDDAEFQKLKAQVINS
jgi:hypothetical protein